MRDFEFIVYNRTENKILLDIGRRLDTSQLINSMKDCLESYGEPLDLSVEERLFPKIEELILKNLKSFPLKTISGFLTANCKMNSHRWCRGKGRGSRLCSCDCHKTDSRKGSTC